MSYANCTEISKVEAVTSSFAIPPYQNENWCLLKGCSFYTTLLTIKSVRSLEKQGYGFRKETFAVEFLKGSVLDALSTTSQAPSCFTT